MLLVIYLCVLLLRKGYLLNDVNEVHPNEVILLISIDGWAPQFGYLLPYASDSQTVIRVPLGVRVWCLSGTQKKLVIDVKNPLVSIQFQSLCASKQAQGFHWI